MDPINVDAVELAELTSSTSDDAAWVGGFFAHGGDGAAASTVIYFAVPEGKRLGRHTVRLPSQVPMRDASCYSLCGDKSHRAGGRVTEGARRGGQSPPSLNS